MVKKNDPIIKVVVLGDDKSKLKLLKMNLKSNEIKYSGLSMNDSYFATTGLGIISADVSINNIRFRVLLHFISNKNPDIIIKNNIKGAKGAIIVFSIIKSETLNDLEKYAYMITNEIGQIPTILLGIDIEARNKQSDVITFEKGLETSKKIGDILNQKVEYMEISTELNKNIDNIIKSITSKIVENYF